MGSQTLTTFSTACWQFSRFTKYFLQQVKPWNWALKNISVCNIGGLDWDPVLGEFLFTSSSSSPALSSLFWAPGSFYLFFLFLFLFLFVLVFFCPEPFVWWLGAGHQRFCVAVDLLLLPRPPRRLLHHEPHPRHTLWVRQNLGQPWFEGKKEAQRFSNSPFGESSRNVFCLLPAASPPWQKVTKAQNQIDKESERFSFRFHSRATLLSVGRNSALWHFEHSSKNTLFKWVWTSLIEAPLISLSLLEKSVFFLLPTLWPLASSCSSSCFCILLLLPLQT